jgi:hypothetical protein
MALTSIGGRLYLPFVPGALINGLSIGTTVAITGAGHKAALVFQAPKTGTIDRVYFRTGTVTTGDTVDVRIETVDGSGNPSGTLQAANTNGACVIADGDDNVVKYADLTAAASVTRGDILAVVIVNGAVPGSMVISNPTVAIGSLPYSNVYGGASWTKYNVALCAALRYDAAGVKSFDQLGYVIPIKAVNMLSLSTSTTPDEVGNIITLPKCRVTGWWAIMTASGARDYDIIFYSGTTALLTKSYDSDVTGATGNLHNRYGEFASTYEAAVGQYRIVLKPTTTSTISIQEITIEDAAIMGALSMGTGCHKTERTDAGAFSETTTSRVMIGVEIDQLDDGVGGTSVPSFSFAMG